jgi:hypothetical protein
VVSQLITLYITPVYYTYLDSFQKKVGMLFRRRRATSGVQIPGEPLLTGHSKNEK